MNLTEVETLISHWGSEPARRGLPILADRWSGQRKPGSSSKDSTQILKTNPGLGWAFANRIVASGRPSPLVKKKGFRMINAAISLLFAELRGGEPPPAANIVNRARELDGSPGTRRVLRAALLATDGTFKSVAAALSLPVKVVAAYHELFFNILDRKDDLDYVTQIFEGENSRSMAFAREQAGLSAEDPLLLIARNGTVEDVLVAAGLGKVVKRPIWECSDTLRQLAMSTAAAWSMQPGNHHKPPPALVKLGLDMVKRTALPTETAGEAGGSSMGELFMQVLEDDRVKLREQDYERSRTMVGSRLRRRLTRRQSNRSKPI